MNIKNHIFKFLTVGLFVAGALFAYPSFALAASNFNDNGTGSDLPTIQVAKYNGSCTSNCGYSSSVSVNPGDIVSVAIYYHNTGPDAAIDTKVKISPTSTSSGTSHSISGSVRASNTANSGNGSATVNISSSQTLTYMPGQTFFYPDKSSTTYPIPFGQSGNEIITSGGLNIGTIAAPSSCSGYPSITFCHQGFVIAHYKVSTTTQTYACSDGVDNDNDGLIDYPQDPGCSSSTDNDEYNTVAPCTINSFSANPTTVNSGNSSTLSWSTSNCNNVTILPAINNVPTTGSTSTGSLSQTTTFTLYAYGTNGNPTAQTTVVVQQQQSPCAINYFNANPQMINTGNSSTLSWSLSNCTSASISPSIGSVNPSSGNVSTNSLTNTTTYTLTASGNGGNPIAQVTVQVLVPLTPCTINYFNGNPGSVNQGCAATLSWSTSNCTSASISPSIGSVNPSSGNVSTGILSQTLTFILNASGNGGNPSAQVTIQVTPQQTQSVCKINSFSASPGTVNYNAASTLVWATSGCAKVTLTSFGAVAATSSTSTGNLSATTIYTLTAYDSSNVPQTEQVTVHVNQPSGQCTINNFSALPSQVSKGGTATLSWATSNCVSVSINPIGIVSATGSTQSNAINFDTTFTLTAYGQTGGPVTEQELVTVNNNNNNNNTLFCTINSFKASPSTIDKYDSSKLSWSLSNCTSASISPSIGSVNPSSGNVSTGSLSHDTTYTLSASGQNGAPSLSQTVHVQSGSNNNDDTSAPEATTKNATNIDSDSATLRGEIDTGNQDTEYYFEYGTNRNNLNHTTTRRTISDSDSVSVNINGLSTDTTYYFRVYATNDDGDDTGSILSFRTDGSRIIDYYPPAPVPVATNTFYVTTTVATNIASTSARLNGVANADIGGTIWFEYGTDQSVPFTTPQQSIGAGSYQVLSAFVGTLSPSTTYYYRIAGSNSSVGTVRGAISSFRTPAASSSTVFVNTTTTNIGGTGSGNIMLKIETPFENVSMGNTVPFTVTYKNISGKVLKDAVLTVTLPGLLQFSQASTGLFDPTTRELTVRLGSLDKNEEGTMNVVAIALDPTGTNGSAVTTATLVFTLPNGAQDEAIAYAFNTVTMNNILAGAALFGSGFLPNSALGWLILILIIIAIIALARRLYSRPRVAHVPQPPHYSTPTY